MSINLEQLKKLKVRYLKCSKGDLHQGEVLNFICIDPQCKDKGLICPVCQATDHKHHHTMHLKMFLTEIDAALSHKSELGGLAAYLISLDATKRDMVKALKDTVEQLSLQVKEVEQKIDQGYCTLRRIVLSQSTVSQRLPQLYRLLTEQSCPQNQQDIIKEIGRYSELLEFKDNKLIAVDSASELVTEYSSRSGLLAAHLTTLVAEMGKIFCSLPLKVDKFGKQQVQEKIVGNDWKFSQTEKSLGMAVEDEGKSVRLSEGNMHGLAFLADQGKGMEKRTASFKIAEAVEGEYINIGIARPDEYQDQDYEINLDADTGLYGLCSFGVLPEDMEGTTFVYEKGDTIDVQWYPSSCKLIFSRRHSIETCETYLPSNENLLEYNFYVALSSNTAKVELVE